MYIEVEPEENIKSMLSEFAPFVGLVLESDKGKCRKKGRVNGWEKVMKIYKHVKHKYYSLTWKNFNNINK